MSAPLPVGGRQAIVIDTDPGQDDAIAILLWAIETNGGLA